MLVSIYNTMETAYDGNSEDKNSTFWKKNTRVVPGRPSPRKESRTMYVPSPSTSFQDFQLSVSDAWDLGDDEFCNLSSIKISKRVSQSAADCVINIHRNKHPDDLPCGNTQKSQGNNERMTPNASELNKDKKSLLPLKVPSELTLQLSPLDLDDGKIQKFENLLKSECLDLRELQNLSWPGIPLSVKAETWRLLAGYAPARLDMREKTLENKREEYWNFVKQYYETEIRDEAYQGTYRQIHIDIPRMSPSINIFRQKVVQDMFERILFIWSVRHPASGYVQGINDLVTPFFVVFLQKVLPKGTIIDELEIDTVDEKTRNAIEADSYWCFSKFLDGIQDNYIFPQLGIQHKINQLRELIQRIDGTLHGHLQSNGIEYLQFSFRWMNNLLTRELPLQCLIRLWDTYLAELETFSSFQLFVCAAFLLNWRAELMDQRDFQGLMLLLQNLPTREWNDKDVSMLVAEAYKLKFTFADAPNHFQSKGS